MLAKLTTRLNARFSFQGFWQLIEQELRSFLFFLLLLAVFRASFIVLLHEYMGSSVGWTDIWTANYYGLKLSLKSAGVLTLLSAAGSLLCWLLRPSWLLLWRRCYGAAAIFLLTLLFFARIPYYEQFLSGFNQLIFNTLHDDVGALLWTLNDEYQLWLRLLGVLAVSWCLSLLYQKWLNCTKGWYCEPASWLKYPVRCLYLGGLYLAAVFVSFGGSMSYVGDIGWENSGVTKDRLLNEAILDDMQALYRAYELNGRLESSTGLMYTAADVRFYAQYLSGRAGGGDDLTDYLAKTSAGAGHDYQHIFLIVSESYANWPLLDRYAPLHLADGMRKLAAQPNSAYAPNLLPNGMSTISAVMGLVTGLADANLYLTTMPEAYEAPYITSLAPQLQRLGYRTEFWYAGPSSWERVRDFSLAQGFDEFYGRGDYPAANGSVWGCDDEYLYQAVLAAPADGKIFSLILNTANHSPYTVDLAKAGFPADEVRAALPEAARADEALLKQLGHFWYADRQLAEFVQAAEQRWPDSLFIIVGDHADRVNIDKTPSMYERYAVPLILHGRNISPELLPTDAAGSQIDIVPLLLELASDEAFTYYSVGRSLTCGNNIGINYGFWITGGHIGLTDTEAAGEAFNGLADAPSMEQINMQVNAVRALSWYIGKHGLILDK